MTTDRHAEDFGSSLSDAFGEALQAHFHGRGGLEVVERDDDYILVSPIHEYFAEYEEWSAAERRAMTFVRGHVLDIGCGAGRHARHLQAAGVAVTSVDTSPGAVDVAKNRGVRDVRLASLDDVTTWTATFDTILMLGNGFSLLEGWSQGRRTLVDLHARVNPGGVLLAQATDPYMTRDTDHREYHERNRAAGRMSGQYRLRIRYGRAKTAWFDYLLASRDEVVEMVRDTGWRVNCFLDVNERNSIVVLDS